MQTKWESQHRRVLVRLVGETERGLTAIDVAAYATALQLSHQQVHESLGALTDGRLIELRYALDAAGAAVAQVVSVSAIARQVFEGAPSTRSRNRPLDSVFDAVVRATSGP